MRASASAKLRRFWKSKAESSSLWSRSAQSLKIRTFPFTNDCWRSPCSRPATGNVCTSTHAQFGHQTIQVRVVPGAPNPVRDETNVGGCFRYKTRRNNKKAVWVSFNEAAWSRSNRESAQRINQARLIVHYLVNRHFFNVSRVALTGDLPEAMNGVVEAVIKSVCAEGAHLIADTGILSRRNLGMKHSLVNHTTDEYVRHEEGSCVITNNRGLLL